MLTGPPPKFHGTRDILRYLRRDTYGVETRADSPVLVRYADLCGLLHKSAYADWRIMPTAA